VKPILGLAGKTSIEIDVARLIETRMLVQASSGGGKSWALRRILEQTCKDVQQLIIDPEGEFSTLREKHDYLIASPRGGDVVAHPKTAALLARRLLETGVSTVLDIYELKAHERTAFVRIFLDALINAPKELWHPVIVVVDESHIFCPENGKAESADAVKNLATRGRKRGFCAILATQRLSKLHKDAAAECFNKLIGRTGLDIDVKRAADELGFTSKEATAILRDLDPGEFYAFGPALSREVVKVQVGAVATTHPKVGERALAVPPTASPKIRKILAELADLPKEAEEEAKTLAELKAENAALKRDLKKIPAPTLPSAQKPKIVEIPVIKDSQIKTLAEFTKRIQAASQGLMNVSGEFATAMARVTKEPLSPPSAPAVRDFPLKPRPSRPKPVSLAYNGDGPGGGLRRILIALAQCPEGLSAKQIGVRAGLSSASGTFSTYLGTGRREGWINGERHLIRITDEGIKTLGSFEPLPTGQDLLAYWLRELGGGASRLLEVVAAAYPDPLTKEEAGAKAGLSHESGTFSTYLGKLRTLELIEGRGELRASPSLFE
jgi:hypothetical protein